MDIRIVKDKMESWQMHVMQFLYIPIAAIALTFSVNAHSVMWKYDLMKVVSVDDKEIVLKKLGALDHTLFTRSDLNSSLTMLCSYSTSNKIKDKIDFSGKRVLDKSIELDCEFINLNLEEKNDEPTDRFWTYLTSLFNAKDIKPDTPLTPLSEHFTVNSGDYAVYVITDTVRIGLIIIDPSKLDHIKTMLSYNRDNWSFDSSTSPLSSSTIGWYTGVTAVATDVDHVVSLKDAYLSGGNAWSTDEKRTFANDSSNHAAALPSVNRHMKNSKTPLRFISYMNSVIRSDFDNGKCLEYVDLYVQIKEKYKLNFINNRIDLAKAACR
tara:strand:+ start:64 stop:1035 length:972 start_codon:yes stop_codon:yes gene_type:complete